MTKASMIACTALIWTAGFAATGFLSYVLRSPTPPARITQEVARRATEPIVLARVIPPQESRIIVLPTVEIVGTIPAPPKAKPATVQAAAAVPVVKDQGPRDIREMHCSPFRPLEQGSSSVQICD